MKTPVDEFLVHTERSGIIDVCSMSQGTTLFQAKTYSPDTPNVGDQPLLSEMSVDILHPEEDLVREMQLLWQGMEMPDLKIVWPHRSSINEWEIISIEGRTTKVTPPFALIAVASGSI